MWLLDGRAVTSILAAGQRPKRIPREEWLRLDNSADGGPTAARLQEQLEAAAEVTTVPPRPESWPES